MPLTSTLTLLITTTLTTSLLLFVLVNSLGSSSTTIAVTYGTATVCAILAGEPTQRILCYQKGLARLVSVEPNVSFEAISGGFTFFCGLRSGGLSLLCWDTTKAPTFEPKRLYHDEVIRLTDLAVGDDQVCAREVNSGVAKCWRGGSNSFPSPGLGLNFRTITCGRGFACGILRNNSKVYCWGSNGVGAEIQSQFSNLTMLSIVAGASHACGLTNNGILVCKGSNASGQLDVPFSSAFDFSGIAAGPDFSCAIKMRTGLVKCWGGGANKFQLDNNVSSEVSFELIVSGSDFLCGLTTRNLSVICWGLGWSNVVNHGNDLPLGMILPGPCVQSPCSTCGVYPNSETLCDGVGNICKSCQIELPIAVPLPNVPPPQQPVFLTKARNRLSLVFVIVGSVGAFAGICSIVYCLWGYLHKRYSNSVKPSDNDVSVSTADIVNDNNVSITLPMRSFSLRNHSSGAFGRQRSSSSSKRMDKTEMFSLPELIAASNNFSLGNKIGAGSFGIVYKGKLADGREVAIKRGETDAMKMKKFQEKEVAFDSELVLLSRLHHKHLVGLVGYCEEMDERLLVYEYMSNGALHDHLHNKNNTEKSSSILNSWKMRIKIALDAARGIEYLHHYAVPPIIHRDIKSSNILLDATWTARVSDFGLSLMGPKSDEEFMSTKAVGTVGYIDPEYYVLNVLTTKSDVYGLGVVLLELLTGKKAVFKDIEGGTGPMGVVEYAMPLISAGELQKVLDKRVGSPEKQEVEAVELMAYTAMQCVSLEGKERPNIDDIVANLERASALCEDKTNGSFTTSFSISSDCNFNFSPLV